MTKKTIMIDVREPDEYLREHVEWAINIPMSTIEYGWTEKFKTFADHQIIILCESGNRAEMCRQIIKHNCECDVRVFEWGLVNWREQWKKTFWNSNGPIPMMRQVQIAAGSMVVIFTLLTFFVSPYFLLWTLFVWSGLTFAGISGTCLLAKIIGLLPYNKK